MSETQSCRRIAHDLTALAQGELSGPSRSAIELHLARCESCKREYDETCKLLALAGDLPRLSSTSRFHQKMMRAVQVEREVIRMPARERLGMAVGYVGYKLRLSRKARLLMYAMAAQVAVLITMVVGFGLIVQKTEIPQPQMEVEPLSDMENRDPGAGNGFQFPDKESLDPLSSSERFFDPPSRLFNDVVTDFTLPGSYKDSGTALPLDLLDRMVEQENRLELSRFRMEARFPWKGRDRISEVRGGDRRTARTVEQGLDGLQRVQAAAGSWDSDGLLGSDSRAVTGITALAVAAFLSDGHTQERGRYAQTVSKGLRFLMDAMDGEGRIGSIDGDPGLTLFNQSIAVLVLAENFILCQGANEKEVLRGMECLSRLVLQPVELDESLRQATCSHAWAAMALNTSLLTGLKLPRLDEAARTAARRVTQQARMEGWAPLHPSTSRTVPPLYSAAGMAIYALFYEETPARDTDWAPLPDPNRPEQLLSLLEDPAFREPSFLFFLGTALCEQENPLWEEWNRRAKLLLTREQKKDGLWAAGRVWPWIQGGDVYTTALHLLTLQVYYRFSKLEEERH